jgi:pimeloyl-ACP methyl ester carboxylesterase
LPALSHAPLLVIRGETSDLLSPATVHEMCARHPNCTAVTVPGEGHAPLLKDAPTIGVIAGFLVEVDAGQSVAGKDLSRVA